MVTEKNDQFSWGKTSPCSNSNQANVQDTEPSRILPKRHLRGIGREVISSKSPVQSIIIPKWCLEVVSIKLGRAIEQKLSLRTEGPFRRVTRQLATCKVDGLDGGCRIEYPDTTVEG